MELTADQLETIRTLKENAEGDPSRPAWLRILLRRSVEALESHPGAIPFLKQYDIRAMKANIDRLVTDKTCPETMQYMKEQRDSLHHFSLSRDVIRALSREETHATINGLASIDALRLPYPAVWISFNLDDFLDSPDWFLQDRDETEISNLQITFVAIDSRTMRIVDTENGDKTFHAVTANWLYCKHIPTGLEAEIDISTATIFRNRTADEQNRGFIDTLAPVCINAVACLVTALATRNIKKRTDENTRAGTHKPSKSRFRAENGTIYVSRTTLDLPDELPDDAQCPARNGTSPRPHLRRGHVHTFLYGPGKQERRQQWVPSMFVNADANFVQQSREYKVKQ